MLTCNKKKSCLGKASEVSKEFGLSLQQSFPEALDL